MFFADLVFAFVIAIILVSLFTWGLGRPGPWGGFVWFFLLVFLAAWAIGAWMVPVGPVFFGVTWIPIFFGALLVALIIAAIPPSEPAPPVEAGAAEPSLGAPAVGLFFWLLIILLIIAVGIAYAY